MSVLRACVNEPEVVARYRAKTREVKGSGCLWWTGAVSARGHGRFWLGQAGDHDVTVIAHRFAWALEHGAAALLDVPVLGHRCDNPLCQRIGLGHVQASSYVENSREYAGRRQTIGAPLRDSRGARGRSRTLRDLLRLGASACELKAAMDAGLTLDAAQLALWDDGERSPTTVNGTAAATAAASAIEAGAA